MKYKVIKPFSKRSEGLKPYAIGMDIELTSAEAKTMIEHGYIKEEKKAPKTKEEKTASKRKTK
jgi:hypothetical protein